MKPGKYCFIRDWRFKLIGVIILLLLIVAPVLAQSGGGYDLSWSIVSGGGGTSSAGTFVLNGVIGQHDAGMMSGGNYSVGGGFWGGGEVTVPPNFNVFLPLLNK